MSSRTAFHFIADTEFQSLAFFWGLRFGHFPFPACLLQSTRVTQKAGNQKSTLRESWGSSTRSRRRNVPYTQLPSGALVLTSPWQKLRNLSNMQQVRAAHMAAVLAFSLAHQERAKPAALGPKLAPSEHTNKHWVISIMGLAEHPLMHSPLHMPQLRSCICLWPRLLESR